MWPGLKLEALVIQYIGNHLGLSETKCIGMVRKAKSDYYLGLSVFASTQGNAATFCKVVKSLKATPAATSLPSQFNSKSLVILNKLPFLMFLTITLLVYFLYIYKYMVILIIS